MLLSNSNLAGDVGNMRSILRHESGQSFARLTMTIAVAVAAAGLLSGCDKKDSATAAGEPRATGEELFVDHCASCHGVEGRGDGPLAAELRVEPSNLRLLAQENGGRFPDRRVQRSIDGRGMPAAHGLPEMPVWGSVWRREGVNEGGLRARSIAITNYLRSIQE